MKKIAHLILCITVIFNGISSYAWGPKGHDIVASIAERHLTKKTRKELDKLLEGGHISAEKYIEYLPQGFVLDRDMLKNNTKEGDLKDGRESD